MSERFASERDTWLMFLGVGATVVGVVALTPLLVTNVGGLVKVVAARAAHHDYRVGLVGYVRDLLRNRRQRASDSQWSISLANTDTRYLHRELDESAVVISSVVARPVAHRLRR